MAKRKYISFEFKVLIPVVSFLILVMAFSIWFVSQRFKTQLSEETKRSLQTAEAVFHNSLEIRSRSLILQYQNIVNEPRFKAVAQLGEQKTMEVQLKELLDEMSEDVEAILFTTDQGQLLAGARRDPFMQLDRMEEASQHSIAQALQGKATSDTVAVGNHLYSVVSAPVTITGTPMGALTIGVRIDETAARELKSLTRGEIIFVANGHIVASTISEPGPESSIMEFFDKLVSSQPDSQRIEEFGTRQGGQYVCLAGLFSTANPKDRLGYLLLSSIDEEVRILRATRRTVWAVGLIGIVISSILISVLIRRITDPLRRLRDSAEAVGRGDFSRRVDVQSNDECGELSHVFNQMTESLSASRAQAETALQTLKNTQVQLVQTEKLSAIGEFVAGIAHELNNPLTAVIGFSEMLQDTGISEHQSKFVKRIIESAHRSHKIVQNLLSFARQHPPERKWVGVNKLIEAAVEILSYETRTSNIEVVTRLDPTVPRVLVDPHQMQQVFVNIINNARHAIEHHQPEGKILISTEVAGSALRITFRDNGPGIPRESLPKIFDPFFTTKPVGIGTGLGLSLTYGIIREHGGSIVAKSQPGDGATFIIDLPIPSVGADVNPSKPALVVKPTLQEGKGKKILVIDDEDPVLEYVREALSRHGYHVDTAREGESAIERFQREEYDLVVCDWKIPGMSGPQIFEKLREQKPAISNRFILITGDLLNPMGEDFLREKGIPCLLKPFSMEELFTAVQKSLT